MAKTQTTANVPTVKLTLRVPEPLYDQYSEQAISKGQEVEEVLARRLASCRDHTSTGAIYLDDATRNELTKITGKLIRNASDLLAWARQTTSLTVDQVEVPLGQTLKTRLSTRTFGTAWPDYIRSTVTRLLEGEVGLR